MRDVDDSRIIIFEEGGLERCIEGVRVQGGIENEGIGREVKAGEDNLER